MRSGNFVLIVMTEQTNEPIALPLTVYGVIIAVHDL